MNVSLSVCVWERVYEEHWQRQNAQRAQTMMILMCVWVLKLKYFSVKLYGNYDRISEKTTKQKKREKTKQYKRGQHVQLEYTHSKTDFMIELFCFCGFHFSPHTFQIVYMLWVVSVLWFLFFLFIFSIYSEQWERERETPYCKFVVNHLISTNFQLNGMDESVYTMNLVQVIFIYQSIC